MYQDGQDVTGTEASTIGRIVDYLRDAIVELEVWRQNARTAEEREALHRVTALLNQASGELRGNGQDPNQQILRLSPRRVPPT